MSRTDELRVLNTAMQEDAQAAIDELRATALDAKRMSNVFYHTGDIITELDKEFAEQTKLDAVDFGFLFLAIALQCARIVIVNKATEIEPAGKGDREHKLKKKQKDLLGKFDEGLREEPHEFYAPLNQIILTPGVPYDAQDGGKEYGLFVGGNHRFATLGHDPILGLVFGTSNILTNTITCAHAPIITTNHVHYEVDIMKGQLRIRKPKIGEFCSTFVTIKEAAARLEDDKKSVIAALIKQIIHIWTDIYTPAGIQLPAANLILSHKNVERLTKYISAGDVLKVGVSAGIAVLINTLIETLHTLLYQEEKHGDIKLYNVKTRKIVTTSNVIATSSNIIWTVGKTVLTKDPIHLKELDIGGLIVMVYRLVTDIKFINEVKREFIVNHFEEKLFDENYWYGISD